MKIPYIGLLSFFNKKAELLRYKKEKVIAVEISTALKNKGIAIVDDFFTDDQISLLSEEYEALLNKPEKNEDWDYISNDEQDVIIVKAPDGTAIDLQSKIECPSPSLLGLLSDDLVSQVTALYYQSKPFILPARLQFIKTYAMKNTPSRIPFIPHADRQRFLKFYIYLDEPTLTNGPLYADLNSNRLSLIFTQLWRGIQILCGRKWPDLQTEFQQDKYEFSPILCQKNSLVIFDTNLPHYAARNTSNTSRRVIIIEAQTQRGYRVYSSALDI